MIEAKDRSDGAWLMAAAPKTIRQLLREQRLDAPRRSPTRNAKPSRFRGTGRWKRVRRLARRQMPLCVDPFGTHAYLGEYVPTAGIHHIRSVADRPDLACDLSNLAGLCDGCHARVSAMERAGEDTVSLFECRDDGTEGDRPVGKLQRSRLHAVAKRAQKNAGFGIGGVG